MKETDLPKKNSSEFTRNQTDICGKNIVMIISQILFVGEGDKDRVRRRKRERTRKRERERERDRQTDRQTETQTQTQRQTDRKRQREAN